MRLALVMPGFQRSEADPFVAFWGELVRELAARHQVTVFPLRYPAESAPYRLHGANILPQPFGQLRLRHSPRLWSATVRAIQREHRRQPFDLVHAFRGNEAGFVGAWAASRIGRPLIVHFDSGEMVSLPEIHYGSQHHVWERIQVAVALRRADHVSGGCRRMCQDLTTALGPARADRVHFAPYGVDTRRFRTAIPAVPESPSHPMPASHATPASNRQIWLQVADLNPVKDQATLLCAFALLAGDYPHPELHLVGGGPALADLRRLAVTLGIADRLRWWGQIPNRVVHHVYTKVHAFVASSLHEGQGVALIEAAACGLPIASTAVGAALDLPEAGTHLATPGDASSLAGAMRLAMATGLERQSACDKMRSAALDLYDWTVCIGQMEAIYAAAIGGAA